MFFTRCFIGTDSWEKRFFLICKGSRVFYYFLGVRFFSNNQRDCHLLSKKSGESSSPSLIKCRLILLTNAALIPGFTSLPHFAAPRLSDSINCTVSPALIHPHRIQHLSTVLYLDYSRRLLQSISTLWSDLRLFFFLTFPFCYNRCAKTTVRYLRVSFGKKFQEALIIIADFLI